MNPAADRREVVVLLHGLNLGAWAMTRIALTLRRAGYRVVNETYPSASRPLEALADDWLPALLARHRTAEAPALHVVTHSMGGIVLRGFLGRQPTPANLGRVVMIAPPNAGTQLVDRIARWWPFRVVTGVNGRRLGTDPTSPPRAWGPWPVAAPLGIIAGERSINPLFSRWIADAPDDGKVSVAATRLAGMHAHLVLPISHTWLIYRGRTIDAVRTFLRTGAFAAVQPDSRH